MMADVNKKSSTGYDFYKISKLDITLIACIIVFSGFFMLWTGRGGASKGAGAAHIYRENELLEKVPLKKDKVFDILDGRMRIEVNAARIRVLSADCPKKVCMGTGWIRYPGQTIVCVPNKVLIEIKSGVPSFLDAVVS